MDSPIRGLIAILFVLSMVGNLIYAVKCFTGAFNDLFRSKSNSS